MHTHIYKCIRLNLGIIIVKDLYGICRKHV